MRCPRPLACLSLLLLTGQAGATTLGVSPADEARYSGETFSCRNGAGGPLPKSALNDEFCDCADGSDEPGTGACAGQEETLFFCANAGSTPRQLYASRVGDGVCDCCDGSDEASLASRRPAAKCASNCEEAGRREKQENEKKLDSLRKGLAKYEENKKHALQEREKRQVEIQELNAKLPALEASFQEAKVGADAEREVKAAAEAAAKAAKAAAEAAADTSVCRWRQTGGCSSAGEREESNDKPCSATIPEGMSGYCDCNGDGVKGEGEQGYECKGTPGTCKAICPGEAGATPEAGKKTMKMPALVEDEDDGEGEVEDEKPVVSEYAKWMDGAEETLSAEGEAAPAAAAKVEPAAPAQAEPASTTTTTTVKTAIDVERDAKTLVDANKNRVETLNKENGFLSDEHLGYSSLFGKTLQRKVSEFTYKINFFDNAKQDHTDLGRWDKWTGPRSAVFDHGNRCWDGPERKLNVKFECGIEEEILDVFEPSKCVYEATLTHPGACDASDLHVLTGGPRVFGPKEEL